MTWQDLPWGGEEKASAFPLLPILSWEGKKKKMILARSEDKSCCVRDLKRSLVKLCGKINGGFSFLFLSLKLEEAGGDASLLFTLCVSGAWPASLLATPGCRTACLCSPPSLAVSKSVGRRKNINQNGAVFVLWVRRKHPAASLAFPLSRWVSAPPALPSLAMPWGFPQPPGFLSPFEVLCSP